MQKLPRPQQLDHHERHGRHRQQRRQAQRRRQHMHANPRTYAPRRHKPRPPALTGTAAHDEQAIRPRGDIQQETGEDQDGLGAECIMILSVIYYTCCCICKHDVYSNLCNNFGFLVDFWSDGFEW